MWSNSFYKSTRRNLVDYSGIAAAQKSYTYNYLHFLPNSRNARIIDLGCSEGISLEWLLMNNYQNIVGVDSDEYAIKIAKNKFNSKLNDDQIICKDALTYMRSCKDNSIEMILMFNVIEHIPKDIILEIMIEIRRTLKQDGYFLAQTGNCENPFNVGLFTRDFTHHVMYTKNSLRQLMIMSGFSEKGIILNAIRYKTTLKNLPFLISGTISGWLVKVFALSMRMYIRETSPLIYCLVRK